MVAELLSPRAPTRSILDAFITRHQHLLELERSAEEEQTRLLNSNCSPKLLEQKGLAIGSLGVVGISVGLGGKSLIELNRPLAYHATQELPPHTIRNGDPVRIEQHVSGQGKTTKTTKKKASSDDEEAAVEGIVYKVSSERIVVAVDGAKEVELPERLRLLKLASSATFDRMERTLAHLQRMVLPDPALPPPKAHNLPLINSLLTLRQPSWTEDLPQTFDQIEGRDTVEGVKWLGERLNDSQKEAIEFCLKAKDVACIHGPPGTGKTHTLIELIFQLLARPSGPDSTHPPRILITTPSNLALDNLLLRLHTLSQQAPYSTLLPPGSILRLGHPTRVHRDLVRETLDWRAENGDDGSLVKDVGKEIQGHLSDLGKKRGDRGAVKGKDRGKKWGEVRELRKEYRQREVKVVNNVLLAAKVVLATCHSAGSKQLNNMLFDVCIVDEATQAVEAVCWVPILKSRKLILAGDPQQLPPTVMSRNAKPVKNSVLLADKKEAANGAVEAVAESGAATTTADVGSEQKTQESSAEEMTPEGRAEETIPDGSADEATPHVSADGTIPQVVEPPIEKTTKPTDEHALDTGVEPDAEDNLQTINPSAETGDEVTAETDDQGKLAPTDTTTELDEAEDLDLSDRPQLRPPRTLETTLFDRLERLYGDGIKRVLKVQYRMNESIASFPSTTLYSNELISDPSVSTRTLLDLPTIVDPTDDEVKDVLEQPVVFFDTAGCEFFEKNEGDDDGKGKGGGRIGEGSKSNENEADVVVKWAKKLVDAGVPEEEIAIVTPYQAQVSLISSLLHDQYPSMTIGSVDGLQGQEREAIILTLVRSNPAGEVGFLGEYRRLNVAMTRARRQLCVVGDSATVGKGSKYLKGWMEWLESNADVRWAGEEQM